jgi:hypothetical protein
VSTAVDEQFFENLAFGAFRGGLGDLVELDDGALILRGISSECVLLYLE